MNVYKNKSIGLLFISLQQKLLFVVRSSLLISLGFCLSLVAEEARVTEEASQQTTENMSQEAKKDSTEEKVISESVLGMNVSGNRELPNVLYIIPWKGNLTEAKLPDIERLIDEVYEPVDPDVFARQVGFYEQMTEVIDEKE
jgi:hypothetical protein